MYINSLQPLLKVVGDRVLEINTNSSAFSEQNEFQGKFLAEKMLVLATESHRCIKTYGKDTNSYYCGVLRTEIMHSRA